MVVHRYLLEAGAPANKTNLDGNTPLHLAAKVQHREKYEDFIKFNSNETIENKKGKKAKDYDSALLGTKYKSEAPNIASITGHTSDNAALYLKIRQFIANGGDINAPFKAGKSYYNTLINYVAYRKPSYFAILELLDNGVSPDSEFDRVRPIHSVCESLEAGVSPWLQQEIADIASLLVERGADINAVDKNGKTPLHLLIQNGSSPELIEEFITLGADPNLRDYEGKLPSELTTDREILKALNYKPFSRFNCHIKCKNKDSLTQESADYFGKRLCFSIGYDLFDKAEDWIWQGANLNYIDPQTKKSPLIMAVIKGNKRLVQLLLEGGADVSIKDVYGATAVHHAAETGNIEIMKILIARGADVKALDSAGSSALHYAADIIYNKGEVTKDMIDLLLAHGLDINQQNYNGETPAYQATYERYDKDFVDYLSKRGANFKLKNNEGISPEDSFKELKEENILGRKLSAAVSSDDTKQAEDLISRGANLDYVIPSVKTKASPIIIAAKKGNAKIVKLLLEAGADFTAQDKEGATAVHYAAENGNIEIMQMLIDHGADVEALDSAGSSVMHYAADTMTYTGELKKDMIALLLRQGLDINLANHDGETPAHKAIGDNCDDDFLDYLSKKRANFKLKNSEGKSAEDYYVEQKEANILGRELLEALKNNKIYEAIDLVNKGANLNYQEIGTKLCPIHLAAKRRDSHIMEILLWNGADLNKSDKYGYTAVHIAAMQGNLEIIKMLAEDGADLNKRDILGQTALYYSVSGCHHGVTNYLYINAVDDLNVKANNGDTPAHYLRPLETNISDSADASSSQAKRLVEEIEYLRELGADLTIQNSSGETALDNLAQYLDEETILGEKLISAIRAKKVDEVQKLIIEGANINYSEGKSGRNPIHHAAIAGNLEILEIIIDHGGDPLLQDNTAATAIHYAARLEQAEVLNFLRGKGFEVDELLPKAPSGAVRMSLGGYEEDIGSSAYDSLSSDGNSSGYFSGSDYHDGSNASYDDGPAPAEDNQETWVGRLNRRFPALGMPQSRDTTPEVSPNPSPRNRSRSGSQSPITGLCK